MTKTYFILVYQLRRVHLPHRRQSSRLATEPRNNCCTKYFFMRFFSRHSREFSGTPPPLPPSPPFFYVWHQALVLPGGAQQRQTELPRGMLAFASTSPVDPDSPAPLRPRLLFFSFFFREQGRPRRKRPHQLRRIRYDDAQV